LSGEMATRKGGRLMIQGIRSAHGGDNSFVGVQNFRTMRRAVFQFYFFGRDSGGIMPATR
jgi:hypothetical protein